MTTEHILFYPHKEYNIKKEIILNVKIKDYVQYGYIKRRDLDKWLNNEVISVKMGMLTPSNKCYRELTILESVLRRIKEQDTTALFDDEDELIPIYIFVSEETDNEWREYLISQGFEVSRKNANREGVKIKKSDIGLHYGKHYGYDTEEVLSERERLKKIREEEENKRKERKLQYEEYIKKRKEEIKAKKKETERNGTEKKETEEKTTKIILWFCAFNIFLCALLPIVLEFQSFKQSEAEKERSEFVADSIRQERQKMYEIACEKINKDD
jgi:hypothetical protein